MEIQIIPAKAIHREGIWQIFHAVVQAGDAYVFPPDIDRMAALSYWLAEGHRAFVAVGSSGEVLGAYILKANQLGLAGHVANAAYMVAPAARGQGVGGLMCEHSLEQARDAGFLAMQFNVVVSTNVAAVKLWEKYGFTTIGITPQGFRHATLGMVDTYIMHRFL